VAGQIAVRAYVTEARVDKLTPHVRALVAPCSSSSQPRRKVPWRAAHQGTQARERIGAGRESPRRFVPEGEVARAGSSARRKVVAHQEVEALAKERLVPVAVSQFNPAESQRRRIGACDGECVRADIGRNHVPAWTLAGERERDGAAAVPRSATQPSAAARRARARSPAVRFRARDQHRRVTLRRSDQKSREPVR